MVEERAVVFFYQQRWSSGLHCELNRKEVKEDEAAFVGFVDTSSWVAGFTAGNRGF